ncbi:MAG: isoaspartyl peptidase/L-asparaginase [Planctomycetota bacterium]|nr:isoaspartyl peptidase/L-asparaginase [Planctomycetota bacterium]
MAQLRASTSHFVPASLTSALICAACVAPGPASVSGPQGMEVVPEVVLAIHGGAGTILRENMSAEMDAQYRAALTEALLAGHAALEAGGDALDAVEAAIRPMEDSSLFNSGRGAVLNDEGEVELDASIMSGAGGQAGAVAGARTPRHPITLARRVMAESPHVLFAGEGADRFAAHHDLELMEPSWFVTPRRSRQLKRMKAQDAAATADLASHPVDDKFGTVGCVALDGDGHLAAGTSTGGMARKAFGRVGDSPIIGAGTWAADATCAVSCTGHGEFFIRLAIAHQLHARMLHGGQSLPRAAQEAVLQGLPALGGSGGCVALDANGTLVAPFTTAGMYRGWVTRDGTVTVRIHGDERP